MGVRLSLLGKESLTEFFDDVQSVLGESDERERKESLAVFRDMVLADIVSADRVSCCGRVGFVREYLGSLIRELGGSGFGVLVVDAVLRYRGIVGGSGGLGPVWFMPLWHTLFDVPWFPGSSIKGALRSVYEWLLAESLDTDIGDVAVRRCSSILFGCSEGDCPRGIGPGAGLVKVLDAYPVDCGINGGLVEADVITRHYDENTKTELDVNPNPVLGLAIAAGAKYRFIILLEKPDEKNLQFIEENCMLTNTLGIHANNVSPGLLGLVLGLLFYVLENVGVGGKTTRGYGFFDQVEKINYIQPIRGRKQ